MNAFTPAYGGQQVTVAMLHQLHDIGPGGLIIAEDHTAPYTLTHSRHMDLGCPDQVIIYGHGDLTHELACGQNVWAQVAGEATDTARPQRDHWLFLSLGTLVRELRECMRTHGMDLTHRPLFDLTPDGSPQVEDVYALKGEPSITLGASCVREHRDRLSVQLRIYDQGRPVAPWPAYTLRSEDMSGFVEDAFAQANGYLARTR